MPQFSIRLQDRMLREIRERAEREHRSVNAQIVVMLEEVLDREKVKTA